MMTQDGRIVGIDVSKAKVDGFIRPLRIGLSRPSTPEGQEEMVAWLRAHGVTAAVMEASGGYERSWAKVLRAAGITVRIVDPKRVRHFARSAGRLAKNDPIDAEMIAWFAETFPDAPGQLDDPDREELDLLVTARAALVRLLTQIGNYAEHRQPRTVRKAHDAITKTVRAQIAKLEAAITASIAANADFAAREEIIESVPGLAGQTAAGLIAWMPELGRVDGKVAAALLGAAPYDDDSGTRKGDRHIKGGRQEIRTLLYMATLGAATRHNPIIKAHYQRLRAKGKPAKVALIACMRKLIVILNTLLARRQKWDPSHCPAAAV
jgi:transposase